MDKCICSLREEDYIVTTNPDCPVHGGLHGKNPYAAIEDKPKRPECGTEMGKCKSCKFLGVQAHAMGKKVDAEPACRRHAPYIIAGTGTGYVGELYPVVNPETDWCGDWLQQEDK